jgi:isocitrate dehydrogenase
MDKVNPSSLMMSGAMMLDYIDWKDAAARLRAALQQTVTAKTVTYDLARQIEGAKEVKTSEFAREIVRRIEAGR